MAAPVNVLGSVPLYAKGKDGSIYVVSGPPGPPGTPDPQLIDWLLDVDTVTVPPVVGDALVWDGTNWAPAAGAAGAPEVYIDIAEPTAATADVIWGDEASVGAPREPSLDDMSDVDLTVPPVTGQALIWDPGTTRAAGTGAFIPGTTVTVSDTDPVGAPPLADGLIWTKVDTITKEIINWWVSFGGDWMASIPPPPPPYAGCDPDPSWMPLTVTAGEQKVQTLTLVDAAGSQIIKFKVTTSDASNYSVDWGDGTIAETFASGIQAVHTYQSSALGGNPLTADGKCQALANITPTAGDLTKFIFADTNIAGFTAVVTGPATITALANGSNGAETTPTKVKFISCLEPPHIADAKYMYKDMSVLCATPVLDTSAVTDFSHMYRNFNGDTLPFLDTSSGILFESMFYSCNNLTEIPPYDTSKGTSFLSMFEECDNLVVAPALDTSSGLTFGGMFKSCDKLAQVPVLNTSNATSLRYMFTYCSVLTEVPLLDTSKCTDFDCVFQYCSKLTSVPAWDMSAGTKFTTTFQGCNSITRIDAFGFRYSFSVAYCALDADALNTLFNNLGTPVTTAAVTITNCPGAATCDQTIATAKGWTVSA
jgi:hypothetical protein